MQEYQRDFPLVPAPFAAIAADLGLAEAEVLDRLRRLHDEGKIARVGATVRPNTAGVSTLAALAVPETRLDEVAAMVSAEPGVNHSYHRENRWNLWFVATAANRIDLATTPRPDQAAQRAWTARPAAGAGLQYRPRLLP